MKRRLFKFSVVLVFLFISGFSYSQEGYKVDHVVIDAGHGGKDPGTVGKISKEKDIALKLALKVGNYIKENVKGVKVTYTRDKDVFVELHKRAKIANDAKADLFISIHCNASELSSPNGTETFVLGMARSERNLRVAQKENASILLETDYDKTYGNFDPYDKKSYVRFKILQSEYRAQSIMLATNVQNEFTNRVKRKDRGVREAGFLVLVNATMPAVLIEAGFLSNPAEEKFLNSEHGQDLLASAIYRAFKTYKKDMEAVSAGQGSSGTPQPLPVATDTDTVKADAAIEQIPDDNQPPAAPTSSSEVFVGVQFTTSTRKKDLTSFAKLEDVWFYEQSGLYKYVSGRSKDLAHAEDLLKKAHAAGYKDAFLVYFLNGERIKRSEAIKLLK